jgi:hypothetical protein
MILIHLLSVWKCGTKLSYAHIGLKFHHTVKISLQKTTCKAELPLAGQFFGGRISAHLVTSMPFS